MACVLSDTATDPRVRRTRKLLQDAFRELVHEKRFSAITVQDITERATVNRATFYAHYKDKEELGASCLRADLETALTKRFAERPALNEDSLIELATGIFEFIGSMLGYCPETAAEYQDSVGMHLQQYLFELMDHWLSRNPAVLRRFPGRQRETLATVLSWSIYGGAYRWSRSSRQRPAVDVCREIVSILLPPAGITNEK